MAWRPSFSQGAWEIFHGDVFFDCFRMGSVFVVEWLLMCGMCVCRERVCVPCGVVVVQCAVPGDGTTKGLAQKSCTTRVFRRPVQWLDKETYNV